MKLLAALLAFAALAVGPVPDRIEVAPNHRYLQHADGRPFFVVGHDEAFGFFDQQMNPKPVLAAFLADMKRRGENTLLVEAENEDLKFLGTHRLNLEFPLGTYNEDIARQFDALLDLAGRNDIYVETYLWDTFHMDHHWAASPYNVKNGGPCRFVSEMLTNPRAIALEKQKFAWAIDRWGGKSHLLAWDLMNEIDTVAGWVPGNFDEQGNRHLTEPDQVRDWVTDMGRFVRETELKRWGHTHLRTVSTTNPRFERFWLYQSPEIDLVTNHQYYKEGTRDFKDAATAAIAVHRGVRLALELAEYQRPYMDTESGPIDWDSSHPGKVHPLDEPVYHAMIWANWASGAAGSGLRWPYPNRGFGGKPYLNPFSPRMARDLAALAQTARLTDWSHFNARQADSELRVADQRLIAYASSDEHQLVGWLMQDDRTDHRKGISTRIHFNGFDGGQHRVSWINPTSGAVVAAATARGPSFELATPHFTGDLAIVVAPRR